MVNPPDGDLMPPLRVLWTRGKGCVELADALSGGHPIRATGDVKAACVQHRIDMLVARKMPHAPLVSTATPIDFDPASVGSVVALVSGGPHSRTAAEVAARIGIALDVPAELVSGFRVVEERPAAEEVLETIGLDVPWLHGRLVEARSARQLIDSLPSDVLLVLGAPGGSWIQRMFFGPGARLAAGAPAGAVVVRSMSTRVFHVMEEPEYVSPLLGAADALRVGSSQMLAVVDHRILVGVVRRGDLVMAGDGVSVGSVMGDPVSVKATDGLLEVGDVSAKLGTGTVPVTDDHGHLIGRVEVGRLR